jgi:hypothetical protein
MDDHEELSGALRPRPGEVQPVETRIGRKRGGASTEVQWKRRCVSDGLTVLNELSEVPFDLGGIAAIVSDVPGGSGSPNVSPGWMNPFTPGQ